MSVGASCCLGPVIVSESSAHSPIVSASCWQGTGILSTLDSMAAACDLDCVAVGHAPLCEG